MTSNQTVVDPNRLYSIAEATVVAGCSRETIRLKIQNKKLIAARIGGGPWRITGESLLNLIAPFLAIQSAVPTPRELNRRACNLLRP